MFFLLFGHSHSTALLVAILVKSSSAFPITLQGVIVVRISVSVSAFAGYNHHVEQNSIVSSLRERNCIFLAVKVIRDASIAALQWRMLVLWQRSKVLVKLILLALFCTEKRSRLVKVVAVAPSSRKTARNRLANLVLESVVKDIAASRTPDRL